MMFAGIFIFTERVVGAPGRSDRGRLQHAAPVLLAAGLPFWALILILIDILVIYGLFADGDVYARG